MDLPEYSCVVRYIMMGQTWSRVVCMVECSRKVGKCTNKSILKGPTRYAGLLLSPVEGFRLRPEAFFALWAKKLLVMLFLLILGHFWYSVVTSVTFSSNFSKFEKNPKLILKVEKF